jgi:hypothetical protein
LVELETNAAWDVGLQTGPPSQGPHRSVLPHLVAKTPPLQDSDDAVLGTVCPLPRLLVLDVAGAKRLLEVRKGLRRIPTGVHVVQRKQKYVHEGYYA